MYIQFLFSWGLGILLAIFWLVVFLFIIRGKQFSPRIVWASFGCYIFLVLLRTGLFAFLLHKQWSKSDGIEKYYTLAYSKKIYVVVGDILLLQGVALVVGIVVWSLLTFVRKRWDYLISKHEVLLLSFGAFIVGWPKVFVFLALVLIWQFGRALFPFFGFCF